MINERLGDDDVAPVLVAGELPHDRKHRRVDLEGYALDPAYCLRMRPNRALSECGLDRLNGLGIPGLNEGGRQISRAINLPIGPRRRRLEPRFIKGMIIKMVFSKLRQGCFVL